MMLHLILYYIIIYCYILLYPVLDLVKLKCGAGGRGLFTFIKERPHHTDVSSAGLEEMKRFRVRRCATPRRCRRDARAKTTESIRTTVRCGAVRRFSLHFALRSDIIVLVACFDLVTIVAGTTAVFNVCSTVKHTTSLTSKLSSLSQPSWPNFARCHGRIRVQIKRARDSRLSRPAVRTV